MKEEHYSVMFSSLTGNTKMLADAIGEVLPKPPCPAFGTTINETRAPVSIDIATVADYTDSNGKDRVFFGPVARNLN